MPPTVPYKIDAWGHIKRQRNCCFWQCWPDVQCETLWLSIILLISKGTKAIVMIMSLFQSLTSIRLVALADFWKVTSGEFSQENGSVRAYGHGPASVLGNFNAFSTPGLSPALSAVYIPNAAKCKKTNQITAHVDIAFWSYRTKGLPACQREINSIHCVPLAARCFSSLQASARTRHATTKQRPPSFIHPTNCDGSLLTRRNTKEPFINRANAPV